MQICVALIGGTTIESGFSMIKYELNREKLDYLMKHRLGRTLLITNQTILHPEEVIKGYRDLNQIEDAFKLKKHRDYLSWMSSLLLKK